MPAWPATFSTPENALVVSVLECVRFTVTFWIERPLAMLSEIGAVMLVLVLWPPRFGNTLSDCVLVPPVLQLRVQHDVRAAATGPRRVPAESAAAASRRHRRRPPPRPPRRPARPSARDSA